MKAIMISDHAKWCALMMNGIKKIEVRKGTALYKATKKLIDEYGYAEIYVYCSLDSHYLAKPKESEKYLLFTKGAIKLIKEQPLNGKVVFKFRCYKVEEIDDWSHLTKDKLYNYTDYYTKKSFYGYAIHISNLEIFDKPKELSEFYSCFTCKRHERIFGNNNIEVDKKYGGLRQPTRRGYEYLYPLIKAPQSWCYIEVEE